jgi:hypothetical protein
VGRGYVLWLGGDGHLTVRDAGGKYSATTLPHQDNLAIAARWATHDDTVVWVTADSQAFASYTLYTATIAVP